MGIKIAKDKPGDESLYLWIVDNTYILRNGEMQTMQMWTKTGRVKKEDLNDLEIDVFYPNIERWKDFNEVDRIDNHGKGDDVWYRLKDGLREYKRSTKYFPINDEKLIEICKDTCSLHRTSEELGFMVYFELDELKNFVTKLLDTKELQNE